MKKEWGVMSRYFSFFSWFLSWSSLTRMNRLWSRDLTCVCMLSEDSLSHYIGSHSTSTLTHCYRHQHLSSSLISVFSFYYFSKSWVNDDDSHTFYAVEVVLYSLVLELISSSFPFFVSGNNLHFLEIYSIHDFTTFYRPWIWRVCAWEAVQLTT